MVDLFYCLQPMGYAGLEMSPVEDHTPKVTFDFEAVGHFGHVGHGAAVPAAAVPAAAAVKRERAETINSEPLSSQQTGVS